MLDRPRHKVVLVVILLSVVLLCSALFDQSPIQADLYLQSKLPEPRDSHFIASVTGGRMYCGSALSSVWLEVPPDFTSEDGAGFHCDPTGSLSQWIGTSGAWDDRGYLIAFYPIQTAIVRPFGLVFEMDPVRVRGVCSGCFAARYYNPGSSQWRGLPTTYDGRNVRVSVQITGFLATSGYPGYADRFLIALFVRPEATPASTPTLTFTPISSPSPTPVSTSTPEPSPIPSLTPSPVLATPSPMMSPTVTATSSSGASAELPQISSEVSSLRVLVVLLGIVGLVLFVTVILVIRKRRST